MAVTPEEAVATFIRRQREPREAEEQRARQLKGALSELVREALAKGLFRRAWLIGSLAWGNHGTGSDVDVVVEGLDPEQFGQLWATLVMRLDSAVDLIRLEDLGASFAKRVLAEGRPLP